MVLCNEVHLLIAGNNYLFQMQRRLYLIGFMGSGKTYIGRRLAGALHLPFLDLDDYLEVRTGRSISRIFEEEGEAAFRSLEAAALRDTERYAAAVIACGGGTPCYRDNMHWMNAHGVTIYLRTPVTLLVDRLIDETAHRPLLRGLDREGLHRFVETKLEDRVAHYRQASVIVEQQAGGGDAIVQELISHLDDITGH